MTFRILPPPPLHRPLTPLTPPNAHIQPTPLKPMLPLTPTLPAIHLYPPRRRRRRPIHHPLQDLHNALVFRHTCPAWLRTPSNILLSKEVKGRWYT
ncbi:hypothetical protein GMOD_00002618 [Pyrenophora seminiperda CCB06]|uniref:Uncharacterized protein n=1 Tax=Pyrenophora seminiperda CCB06 TaxID=1302712 RepID=A0A3M7M304_9PLEO|nr:hypothetical protein GMOD_00002618 [Pyrenophora seminiperda CCB06]